MRPAQTRAAVSAATPYRGGVSVQPSEQHRPAPETDGFSAAPTSGWRHRLTARRQWLAARREQLRRRRILNAVYRSTVGVVGLVVVVIGIIAIPYPGPGWAIFFLGLALLATEFAWAQRSLRFTKARYDAVMDWLGRQHPAVQALGAVLTAVVVLVTLWVVGAVGWGAALFGVDRPWLRSPIGIGS